MYPASAAGLALEFAVCCVNAVKIIKRTVETMKKTRQKLLDLLRRVERMRTILELLRSLASQLLDSGEEDWFTNLNEEACRQTMRDLTDVANEIARIRSYSTFLGSAKWVFDEKHADKLVNGLSEQESQISNVVTLVSAKMTAQTLRDVRELKDRDRSALATPFDELILVDGEGNAPSPTTSDPPREPLRTWLGHITSDKYDDKYVAWRKNLSDAAYYGEWDDFWNVLEKANRTYGESWINAIRLKPLVQANEMSFWTPLHQAVYNFAPVEVVQRMIDEGALRTLRCRYASPETFPHMDMTPLEVAQELGYVHLYDILCPVLRYQIPVSTLVSLEEQFHDLIQNDLEQRIEDERIQLPILSVLTELKIPQLWFPVHFHTYSPAGYIYRLDGRELVVRSYYMEGRGVVKDYRITESEIFAVGDPIVNAVYDP